MNLKCEYGTEKCEQISSVNKFSFQTLRSSKSGKVLKDCGNLEVKDIDLIAEGTTPVGQYLSSILDIIPSSKYLTTSKTLNFNNREWRLIGNHFIPNILQFIEKLSTSPQIDVLEMQRE